MTIPPEFRLSNGDVVSLRAVSGTVADDQRSADTQVWSVGGGGYVGPQGGRVEAPEILTSTTHHQLVWITDAAGQDHAVDLTNQSIPVRVGQSVTAFFCSVAGSPERCDHFVNRTARLVYTIARNRRPPIDFSKRYRIGPVLKALIALVVVIGLAMFVFGRADERERLWYPAGALFVLSIARNVRRQSFAERLAKEYKDRLEEALRCA